MRIERWNPHRKGYLLGFADVEMDEEYIVRGVTVHRKGDRMWVNPPAKSYRKEDGSEGWSRVFDFVHKETYWKWSDQVVAALKVYQSNEDATGTDDEVPW